MKQFKALDEELKDLEKMYPKVFAGQKAEQVKQQKQPDMVQKP